ncbi:MAG: hypothetical protein P9L94_13305 [Candidatus Hinthialibacter antarcticus]|nr:hypothetical protein [Candidatus Hinthialibacter antarcticus]
MRQIILLLAAYLFAFTLVSSAQAQRPVLVSDGGVYIADPTNDLTWLFHYIELDVYLYPPANIQRVIATIEHTMGEGDFEITLGDNVTDSSIIPSATKISFDIQITPDSSQERMALFTAKPVLHPSIRRPGSNMYPYALQKWKSFAFYDALGNQVFGDSHANPIRGSGDQPIQLTLAFEGFSHPVENVYRIAIKENSIYPPNPMYQSEEGQYMIFADGSFLGEETFLVRLVDGSEYRIKREINWFPSELILSPNSSAAQWEIYK